MERCGRSCHWRPMPVIGRSRPLGPMAQTRIMAQLAELPLILDGITKIIDVSVGEVGCGRVIDGFVAAIGACGKATAEHFFPG